MSVSNHIVHGHIAKCTTFGQDSFEFVFVDRETGENMPICCTLTDSNSANKLTIQTLKNTPKITTNDAEMSSLLDRYYSMHYMDLFKYVRHPELFQTQIEYLIAYYVLLNRHQIYEIFNMSGPDELDPSEISEYEKQFREMLNSNDISIDMQVDSGINDAFVPIYPDDREDEEEMLNYYSRENALFDTLNERLPNVFWAHDTKNNTYYLLRTNDLSVHFELQTSSE
jgi:hypothetical protein